MKYKPIIRIAITGLVIAIPSLIFGQNSFLSTTSFDNKVLFNPSQAGISQNINMNMVFKTPMNNSQSGLANQFAFSADMPVGENAGIGLVLDNENAGILKQSLFNLCYAYGIKFKENLGLRFGIGAGFKNTRVDASALSGSGITGDPRDPTLLAYNSTPPSFYNSFSMTLTSKNLEFQTVLPNLTANLQNNNLKAIDYAT